MTIAAVYSHGLIITPPLCVFLNDFMVYTVPMLRQGRLRDDLEVPDCPVPPGVEDDDSVLPHGESFELVAK